MREFIIRHNIIGKLMLTAAYLGLVLILWLMGAKCIFISLFKVPCPGCGMSRAVSAALRLDFLSAFRYHMMFWAMPVLYLYFLFDGHLFPGKTADRVILISILAGFTINWAVALLSHFAVI